MEVNERTPLGYVVSLSNTPNEKEFYFYLEGMPLRLGSYVEVPQEDGRVVFGYVSSILRKNPYFEFSEGFAWAKLSHLRKKLPWKTKESTLIKVNILGEIVPKKDKKAFSFSSFPPNPSAPVYPASEDTVKKVFELSGQIFIGHLLPEEKIEVRLDLNKLFKKHLAILAMSGAGKSHLSKLLIWELLKIKGPSLFVLDFHGEYVRAFKSFERVKVIPGEEVKIKLEDALQNLTILSDVLRLSDAQYRRLYEVVKNLRKREESLKKVTLEKLKNEIESRIREQGKGTEDVSYLVLNQKIDQLKGMGLIEESPSGLKIEDVTPGNLYIIDFSSTTEEITVKNIRAYYLLKKLFEWRQGTILRGYNYRIPPSIVFVEEAHTIASQYSDQESSSLSRRMIEKIAREGRKFLLSLVLISQRPNNLSQTALAQCSNTILLRITNPNDLDYVKKTVEAVDSEVHKFLPSLSVGEALIVGEVTKVPMFVKIREDILEEVKGSSTDITYEEEVKAWEREYLDLIKEGEKLKEDIKKSSYLKKV